MSLRVLQVLLIVAIITSVISTQGQEASKSAQRASNKLAAYRNSDSFGRVPLGFEANRGQTDASVKYLTRGEGYTLFLKDDEAIVALHKPSAVVPFRFLTRKDFRKTPIPLHAKTAEVELVHFRLVGARKASMRALDQGPFKSNYIVGRSQQKWTTDVANYRRVQSPGVYRGVDVTYYGNRRQLEFDYAVSPQGDPNSIRLYVDTRGTVSVDPDGSLKIATRAGDLKLHRPEIYQVTSRGRRNISGSYVQRGSHEIGFSVGSYDRNLPLIIDPVLTYSTYLGGSDLEYPGGIAADADGNAYVWGTTFSLDFPTLQGYSTTANANGLIFVSKLDPTGTSLLYSTYLGGTGGDFGYNFALGQNGNVYVVGETNSSDFPVVGGFQPALAGAVRNGFLARIDTTQSGASSLVYSTYLGGGGNADNPTGDVALSVATDSAGVAYVSGQTTSDDSVAPFPITPDAYQLSLASTNGNAFITLIDTNQTGSASLKYSTYLGGASSGIGDSSSDITVDSNGIVYLTGTTNSGGEVPFPTTANAYQTVLPNAAGSAFLTAFDTNTHELVYSSYLGGTDGLGDWGSGIAIDGHGKVYMAGSAWSSDFPMTSGAYQTTNSTGGKGFVAKFDIGKSGAESLVLSTYLGGSNGPNGDVINDVAVGSEGDIYVVGNTSSSDFPTTAGALQSTNGSSAWNGFLSHLKPDGSALLYSSYWGGSCGAGDITNGDFATGVAGDGKGNIYITGSTCSTDYPVSSGSVLQPALAGTYNTFVAKFTFPFIQNIDQNILAPGVTLVVTGTGFGATQGSGQLVLNNNNGIILSWSDTQIRATVPDGTLPGFMSVFQNSGYSNSVPFTVPVAPVLGGISTNNLVPGSQLLLSGSGFGATQGTGQVFLGTAGTSSVAVLSWSESAITVLVPPGTQAGSAFVSQYNLLSNGIPFTIAGPPGVSGISPSSGSSGTSVIISGSNFGAPRGLGQVRLGAINCEVVSWATDSIEVLIPAGSTSGQIQVSQGGQWSNGMLFTVSAPVIQTVTPGSGSAGTPVYISGSGFGDSQGSASVWIGTALGIVTGWSDSQITANVAPGAASGNVQVVRNGYSSNAMPFVVTGPEITGLSTSSAAPGTSITISGSGFGSEQGNGSVWLGSTTGTVTSWQDATIVATVAANATSGIVQVLQNGTQSNAVPFNVTNPHISDINPVSGPVGTSVAIFGSGFGDTPGSITLAGNTVTVDYWSDTEIDLTVTSSDRTGVIHVLQNGITSNGKTFTLTNLRGTTGFVQISPSMMNLLVDETSELQSLDQNGSPVTGLAWSVSDSSVATLSSDDPPVLTAVAPGTVTITAGDATAEVTVFDGDALPEGTVKWSVPGDGSGVALILPAVPSSEGVADVFALQNSGNVQAITSGGKVAWMKPVNPSANLLPDFQGGLVVVDSQSITKFDGMTGQTYPAYTFANPPQAQAFSAIGTAKGISSRRKQALATQGLRGAQSSGSTPTPSVVVHPDGTVFTVDGDKVVGIDPKTGKSKFAVTLEHSIVTRAALFPCSGTQPGGLTDGTQRGGPSVGLVLDAGLPPDVRVFDTPPTIGNLIIAGDGNAYAPYYLHTGNSYDNCGDPASFSHLEVELKLIRVDSSGSVSKLSVKKWAADTVPYPTFYRSGETPNSIEVADLITDADKGVLLGWKATIPHPDRPTDIIVRMTDATSQGLSESTLNLPGISTPVQPMLQQSDGTFIGVTNQGTIDGGYMSVMVAFDWHGNVKWTFPGAEPKIATSDGGVIALLVSGETIHVDNTGKLDSQTPNASTQSWRNFKYQYGSINQIGRALTSFDASYWALAGSNIAVRHYEAPEGGLDDIAHADLTANAACNTIMQNLTAIANSSGRLPDGVVMTKEKLIQQIHSTASNSEDYIFDGPAADTEWNQCSQPNCVAKFPAWMTGGLRPDGFKVRGYFSESQFNEALSQYNGYAIWIRLDDWHRSRWHPSSYTEWFTNKLNYYGLGTLLHETLHKRSVAGGFSHSDLLNALDIAQPPDGQIHNAYSETLGSRCFSGR